MDSVDRSLRVAESMMTVSSDWIDESVPVWLDIQVRFLFGFLLA